jgi:hypothetical protein
MEIEVTESFVIMEFRGIILCMSEAAKDVKFVAMILEAIGIEIELPITMYCANVGAIFMAENATTTARTQHVNATYHFLESMWKVDS